MRIVILTCSSKGIASRVLPELCANDKLEVAGVVLALGYSSNKKKTFWRKLDKIRKIGILGALNGIRIRKWFADTESVELKELCAALNVPFHETPFINSPETKSLFKQANADLGLSLGNGYIPSSVFRIPTHGMLNIHTEILPRFQGAQSIIWPIFEGVPESGFTIHQVEKKIDAGAILYQEKHAIEFMPTMRQTVIHNLKKIRKAIPAAFSHVCENYSSLKEEAKPQGHHQSYTTPTFGQFRQMLRNHQRMFEESQGTSQDEV